MRQLTFKGYLHQYVRTLSNAKTNGLYQLAYEAATNNPRLREPLLLYALFSNKEEVLLKAIKDNKLYLEYTYYLEKYNAQTMEQALINCDNTLPERLTRVYQSYLVIRNKVQNENHTKLLMHNRILKLQKEKRVSTYRIFTDLNLNHGNVNAFLKHGDCSKLSLAKVRSTLEYLESFPANA